MKQSRNHSRKRGPKQGAKERFTEVIEFKTRTEAPSETFQEMGLGEPIQKALATLGFEAPTSIQGQSIPVLLEGGDLIAQAQTGTGKTAAFALPILSRIDMSRHEPQSIVIAPTRELAIQVAEAFQSYAKHVKGFNVIPIYGGQDFRVQLKALNRGAHVIVGTPGRMMDHLRRGTLSVESISSVVLDEADEMLKMGFIDDIEWILEQIGHDHQTALFSATMPTSIQKIAKRYLKDATKIQIKPQKSMIDPIEQFYMRVSRNQKLDVLTRYLEVEEVQAAIIFARTKNDSAELAERLRARGYAAAALNGDMNQSLREKVIGQIKSGTLDIIVATDVAARGIDVERVSHVINYDIPYDTESYIHRIGRTGRAGRKGKALLFVTPREHRMLSDIERAISKKIQMIEPPSLEEMKEIRSKALIDKITNVITKSKKLGPFYEMIENIKIQNDCHAEDIAAAFAYLLQQTKPMPSKEIKSAEPEKENWSKKPKRSGSYRGKSEDRPHAKKRKFSTKKKSTKTLTLKGKSRKLSVVKSKSSGKKAKAS